MLTCSALLAALTLFPACGTPSDGDTGSSTSDSSGDGDGDTTASESADSESTSTESTGDGDGDAGDGDGDGDGDGSDTTEETGCDMSAMDGEGCEEDCDCVSEQCFIVAVLGGTCGECNEDSDCPDGGCTIPNPLNGTGSTCNEGNLGDGCEDSSVCQGDLECQLILDVAGILEASTCSECGSDSDCADPTPLCTVQYDIANVSGQKVCVAEASVPNGDGCDLDGSGAMACESGICNDIDIMGLVSVGVCGDCESDADCPMGETCTEGSVDLEGGTVTPSACG